MRFHPACRAASRGLAGLVEDPRAGQGRKGDFHEQKSLTHYLIDGGLVGGASLKPEVFSEIIEKTAAARA